MGLETRDQKRIDSKNLRNSDFFMVKLANISSPSKVPVYSSLKIDNVQSSQQSKPHSYFLIRIQRWGSSFVSSARILTLLCGCSRHTLQFTAHGLCMSWYFCWLFVLWTIELRIMDKLVYFLQRVSWAPSCLVNHVYTFSIIRVITTAWFLCYLC